MSNGEGFSKELPNDILVEILVRLPPKSFNRCKAVSKSWLALTLNPQYSKKFHKFRLSGLFCKLDDTSGHKTSVTHFASLSPGAPLLDSSITNFPHHKDCDLELLDCCNGLLLFRCQTVDPPCFYISNPYTKKWFPFSGPTSYHGRFVLVYDPSISPHFQVLFFEISKTDNTIQNLIVLSSEKVQWQRSEGILPNSKDLSVSNAKSAGSVLINGTLYLLVSSKILALNLNRWSSDVIQLPDTTAIGNDRIVNRIVKCHGKMQYISSTSSMIQIWSSELQSKEKWMLNYELNIQELFGNYIRTVHPRPIQIHPDHDILYLFCWKDENTRTIVSYDLTDCEMEEVSILKNKFEKGTFYYIPSFSDDISMNISASK